MAVIAIDIGGTKIKAGVMDRKYDVLSSFQVPTQPKKGRSHFLANLSSVISSLISGSRHKITAIGISLPGGLDSRGRSIDVGNALSFLEGFNLTTYLQKRFSLPIHIGNDADCFLIAETTVGRFSDSGTVLGIIWGSGVGSSLSVDGVLQNFPMEFGHNKIFHDGKLVDLELVAGGLFMQRIYKRSSGSSMSVQDIYHSNDKLAKKVFSDAVNSLGLGISHLVNVIRPDVIVMGGGVSQLPTPVYKKLLSVVKKNSLKDHFAGLRLERYSVSDDAGLIGAGVLAIKN